MGKVQGISGVVLAGGKSRRMGQDKRFLNWKGKSLVDTVCERMTFLFDEVLMVTAVPDIEVTGMAVRVVSDCIPNKGSIGGLFTGLRECRNSYCFAVACDMPYLNPAVISRICGSSPADVVMVRLLQGLQPLHARYSKRCLPVLEEMIHADMFKIQRLCDDPRVSTCILEEHQLADIDPSLLSFMNINTPADWVFAKKTNRDSSG